MDATSLTFVPWASSTNDLVCEDAFASRRTPFAVATFDQRSGRGRQGRTWQNRPGDSLALTYVLRPRIERDQWGWLSLAMALAVQDALEDSVGAAVELKWPNDVLDADGRKLAGILAAVDGERVAVGVGVNLRGGIDAGDPLLANAGTVEAVIGRSPDDGEREQIARAICAAMDHWVQCLETRTGADEMTSIYRERCVTISRAVRVVDQTGSATIRGTAETVDSVGRLVIRAVDGTRTSVTAGDVHLVPDTNERSVGA